MEQPQTGEIRFLAFARLCFKEALRTSVDKADWLVLLIGAALGPVALLFPRWETPVTRLLLVAPMSALASVIIFRIFLSPLLVYRNKETAGRTTENGLREVIAGHERTIRQQDQTIRSLSEKPNRTPAEQHAYDTLEKALEVTKETGLIALRHLKYHEKLTFGTYNPELPPGLTREQTLWVYNHCLSVGVVNRSANLGYSEYTYSLSPNPAMTKALDELLFAEG